MEPVHFVAYSDYLCPWCFNATVRLRRLEDEFAGSVRIEWRSYLLRPRAGSIRDLEKFRAYTNSWLKPAAEPDSGTFRVWASAAGPPSHSVPPHLVAKAAAQISDEAFRRVHERLMHAYFADNLDITDVRTLRGLWQEVDLPDAEFRRSEDPGLLRETFAQHAEALEIGATGVPAVRLAGEDNVIVGAQPLALYRKWVERVCARRGGGAGSTQE